MSSFSEHPRDRMMDLMPGDVRAYLLEHPDFLEDNGDLLELLVPPESRLGEGVQDFQRYMLAKLQDDFIALKSENEDLMNLLQEHLQRQNRLNAAMLALMDAPDFATLLRVIGQDFVTILDQEAVGFFFETGGWLQPGDYAGLRVVAPGLVGRWLNGREIILEEIGCALPDLFGEKSGEVHSQALIRLVIREGMPHGLLALGHRDPMHYATGLATEQIECLGGVIERCMRKWLTQE